MFKRSLLGLGLLSLLAACSSSEKKATTGSKSGGDSGAGDTYLGLTTPEPGHGFQVRDLGTTIPAGSDLEYCEVAELPGDPTDTYYVNRIEFANGDRSHHLIVTAATPGGVAEEKLRSMNIGDRVPCLSGEQAFGQDGMEGVGGIQQHYGDLKFPEGVGRVYHGKQRIVFDYHYFNSGTDDVHALSAVNFHTTDVSAVQHLARGFGFYNWTIDTPAGQKGAFKAECKFQDDVMISGITRHTHRWGTDYSVWYSGGAHDGEHIWTSTDWQHDVDHPFAAPQVMKSGEGFQFECDYDNTESHDLRFGTQASDEMCILFGLIWSGTDMDVPDQNCDITWVDDGGVGHSAKDPAFPPPADADKNLCLAGSSQGGTPDACSQCRCDECATPILKCFADTECKAILDCFGQAGCDIQSTIDAHSSAAGMATQIRACLDAKCPVCTQASGTDAG
ncbi:MAG TPA: hypothetical protein VHE30_25335 [Polyangiaceae bacterium]|nr:hypothetical protein [Polyangiaceae bacterium]